MSCDLVDFIMQEVMAEMRVNQFSESQIQQVEQTISPKINEKIIINFGGNEIYIPKRSQHKPNAAMELAKQFNGNNIAEIAKNNRVTRRTVYRAIKSSRIKTLRDKP